jgi:hypothetical protein
MSDKDQKAAPAAKAPAEAVATTDVNVGTGFTSPWMEVREVPGAGFGWFSTKAIPAGTVLVLERGLHSITYRPSELEEKYAALL